MSLLRTLKPRGMPARYLTAKSVLTGALSFLLFAGLVLFLIWHKRSDQHHELLSHSARDLQQTLSTLTTTLSPLQQFTSASCPSVSRELTARAAAIDSIRAILLVRDGLVWCSSATGALALPASDISPLTDLTSQQSLRLISGSPPLPERPGVVFWLKQDGAAETGIMTILNLSFMPWQTFAAYHPGINTMALVIGGDTLINGNYSVLPHQHPATLASVTLPHSDIQLMLYGHTLSARDYYLALLTGLLFGLFGLYSSALLCTRQPCSARDILLAIKRNEFYVEYQPLIMAHSRQPYGIEALLRWRHPTQGTIPPDIFISDAEAHNLIIPLTQHLFRLVAHDARCLSLKLPRGTCLSLNLSPLHLTAESFRHDVQTWLAAMPVSHFRYVFEVTERSLIKEETTRDVFAWLHANQFKLAIDDFGTGHSALIYLEKYRFDYLKIDRSFVQNIGTDTLHSPVLETVLLLAKQLNMQTVAEGVETSAQARWLISRGVTHLQGYLFSRPLCREKLIGYYQNLPRAGQSQAADL